MSKIIFLLLNIALLFGCSTSKNMAPKKMLSATEFYERIQLDPRPQIIDVRTAEEFKAGHIVKAQNIDWQGTTFDQQVQNLNKSLPVYVYCRSGKRSSSAIEKMQSLGFRKIYELPGGILEWREKKLPEEKSE